MTKHWEYIKGILTITLEFLTPHANGAWPYSISSEITSVCDPTYVIHQAELLPHGKHPKVNVLQWRADPHPDPGQLTDCDYTCFVLIILVLSARAHHSQLEPVLSQLLQK